MDGVWTVLENIGSYLLLIKLSDILDIAIMAYLVFFDNILSFFTEFF